MSVIRIIEFIVMFAILTFIRVSDKTLDLYNFLGVDVSNDPDIIMATFLLAIPAYIISKIIVGIIVFLVAAILHPINKSKQIKEDKS